MDLPEALRQANRAHNHLSHSLFRHITLRRAPQHPENQRQLLHSCSNNSVPLCTTGSFHTSRIVTMPATPEPAPAPTRNERKACWSHRDSYFACLTRNGVTIPPGTDMSDGRGPVGKAAKEEQERLEREKKQTVEEARKQDPCLSERQGYETNCARSWVSSRAKDFGKLRMQSDCG